MAERLPGSPAARARAGEKSGSEPAPLVTTLTAWAAGLRLDHVPERVVALATSQVIAQLAAIRAGLRHSAGAKLVRAFGPPLQPDPRRSAGVLAMLGSWLNLDDTAYAGHLAPSTVAVPLAYAHAGRHDGRALLTAVIAANECAARITAAATLGPLRGQSALHTHLAGAVAGRLSVERAPAARWADAFGLAFASPPWPVMHAFLGGDAKLVHVLAPVRSAMDACDAAAAGLTGMPDIMEHANGFLARFATTPLPEVITAGLGRHWHTETLSFKVRPGGPGIDAAVDCALELHPLLGGAPIAEVEVAASAYTLFAGRQAARYLAGPRTPISALLLSTAYPVATALLTGDLTVEDFDLPAMRDPVRWALADRIRLVHDPRMTSALLGSVAPFGAALRQAGERGLPWLRDFAGDEIAALAPPGDGGPPDFTSASKATPARVVVRLADGRTFSRERDIPIGSAGPDTRRRHRELVSEKFLAQGGDLAVAGELGELAELPAERLRRLLAEALR
ncbi:MmgE/PrpD family protein [Microbispora sp. RL4-1S]|uniref:MmgE/PrpD family protein n=1 Tax=Microbispora oryzae TaxID=2806554 RepID=A0A940WJE8_9ACTN|nr:MmgE/PrpD family protein [Microbispora oryzae]MBP2706819.1 MmgE/PrpD family protein [Microbispora oryzae]